MWAALALTETEMNIAENARENQDNQPLGMAMDRQRSGQIKISREMC